MTNFSVEIKEINKITGRCRIYSNGLLVFDSKNLVVNDGAELMASRLYSNTDNFITHMGIGDDTTPVLATQTALLNEVFRKAVTSATHSGGTTTFTINVLNAEANFLWGELALFNDATVGSMYDRVVVNFNKTASDSVVVIFDIVNAGA
jgi:hypothetical protein